jgi:acetyl-CoA acetyltransferase
MAGDVTTRTSFAQHAANCNSATRGHLAPVGHGGPNSLFAMLTKRQATQFGLKATDYGNLVIAQRAWASGNPLAAYRTPLTMEEYLNAPLVAPPLRRFDCVPIVSKGPCIAAVRSELSAPSSARFGQMHSQGRFFSGPVHFQGPGTELFLARNQMLKVVESRSID